MKEELQAKQTGLEEDLDAAIKAKEAPQPYEIVAKRIEELHTSARRYMERDLLALARGELEEAAKLIDTLQK